MRWQTKSKKLLMSCYKQTTGTGVERYAATVKLLKKQGVKCTARAVEGVVRSHKTDLAARTVTRRKAGGGTVRSGRGGVKRGLFYSDLHIPYNDPVAEAIMWDIVREHVRPLSYIINGGDLWDCHAISKFARTEPSQMSLKESRDKAREHLAKVHKMFPRAEKWFLPGNHEARWTTYFTDKPEVHDFEELSLESALQLEKHHWRWVERKPLSGSMLHLGKLMLGHFNRCLKDSGRTAKALSDRYSRSIVQAHTHRLGAYHKTNAELERRAGYEAGCLCDISQCYIEEPDWQQGFLIINITKDGYFTIETVPIIPVVERNVLFAFYGGKYYERKTKFNIKNVLGDVL